MLIRQHLRKKCMQFLYAHYISKSNPSIIESHMLESIDKIDDLYICFLNLILILKQKANHRLEFIKKNKITEENFSFLSSLAFNKSLEIISENAYLKEYNSKNKHLSWNFHKNHLDIFFRDSKKNFFPKQESSKNKFNSDQNFILDYYKNYLSLHPSLENWALDQYFTWGEDFAIANNMVTNTLSFISEDKKEDFRLYKFYKNDQDKEFIIELYRKTLLGKDIFNNWISKASNQWGINRIAPLDLIVLQMALCEFLYFPTIPPKVSMNEYIEMVKIYSSEKSKSFINGVLNRLFEFLSKESKIIKTGKGLI